jgi:hypothetical protein
MQMAELHYLTPTSLDTAALVERAESLTASGIEVPAEGEAASTLQLFHTQYRVESSDGSAPAQTTILANDSPSDPDRYQAEIQQSWECDDARERLAGCTSSCLVTEMMSLGLPPADRLRLFHGVLQAVVEQSQPHAIVFRHSQQVVAPELYLEASGEAPIQRPGSFNVRFFRVEEAGRQDMLMDTRGLDEIGLHDLQCHYRDLEPSEVARVLFNTALYLAEQGPVIESGQTITGVQPDSRWRCQFEHSLLEPERELLDLDPGPPWAAGDREPAPQP